MNEPSHDNEEFERIPWGHLSASPPSRAGLPANWRLAAYGLAGAIAAAGLTASLVSGRGAPVPVEMPATIPLTPSTLTSTLPTASSVSAPVTEAELMAVSPAVAAGEAAAWSEVLTESYFGVDGSAVSLLATFLPANTPVPVPAAGQRVFVESVKALSVIEESPGLFRIVVRASLLSALGDGEYQRIPPQALAWMLVWEREGWRLVDLPEQVEVPPLLPAEPLPSADLPEVIRLAAADLGTVLDGGPVGDLWRVVVAVTDSSGGSWPVVKWYSPDGIAVTG